MLNVSWYPFLISFWLMPYVTVISTLSACLSACFLFQVKPALPILRQLIYLNDEEVLTDACWALSYLSDGPNEKIQAVIEAGVCQRLMELLM